ncbi:MAG: hypothetical protein OXN17_14475 [Candidatus Poribacteria bacterium]|nr:hypothetical protein [Candidatus Poribacteria bacterium]
MRNGRYFSHELILTYYALRIVYYHSLNHHLVIPNSVSPDASQYTRSRMFPNRKNAIIGGSALAVLAGFAISWGFAANSGSAAGGNLGNLPLGTLLVGIFGVVFTVSQTGMIFAIRQLSNQMNQMDARLTNQIGDLDKRMHERFLIIETRFTQMEERFTQLENRIVNRIDGLERRIDGLENRIDSRFAQVEERFTQVDIRLDNIQQNYVDEMKYRLREE